MTSVFTLGLVCSLVVKSLKNEKKGDIEPYPVIDNSFSFNTLSQILKLIALSFISILHIPCLKN